MRKLYYAAHTYMILGLVSGLAYREITKIEHFTGETQLGLLHTHLLALGMLFFLIVIVLEKLFTLTASSLFGWFFWTYNTGLALTVAMMAVHGTRTVYGRAANDAVAGLAGLGHVVLTLGLIFFFVLLGKRLPRQSTTESDGPPESGGVPPRGPHDRGASPAVRGPGL